MLDDTANMSIAATDWFGLSLVPSWFHVKVMFPLFAKLQLLEIMFNDSEHPLLVFLTYIVRWTFVPAVMLPQLTEVKGTVHPASE